MNPKLYISFLYITSPGSGHNTSIMPFLRVYLHCVWSTKERIPYLSSLDSRRQVWTHIKSYALTKEIHCFEVSGFSDHCHCLLALHKDQSISKVVQLLKGESSHWINQQGLILDRFPHGKFAWQGDYFVESISSNGLGAVRNYLAIQEVHHKGVSFEQEYQDFFKGIEDGNLPLG